MHRSLSVGVGLLFTCVVGLTSGPAFAERPAPKGTPLYVLAIWTEDSDDQAEALTRALRWRARQAPGWSLLETNQSFETLAIALKCPPKPDTACLQRIGDQLKADRYVWGTMEKKKGTHGEVSADLHLWTRGKPPAEDREDFADNLKDASDESLRAIASALFGRLTGAVSSGAPPSVSEPAELTVPAAPAPTDAPSPGSDQPFSVRMAFGYSALAAGAAFLVASVVETSNWIHDNNASSDDRKLVPRTVTDVCTADPASPGAIAAQDACSKSKDAVQASTLAWIFAGVGAALAGTGVWLIASDHEPREGQGRAIPRAIEKVRLMLVPSVEPRAGRLDVRVTF
jgi:hypothetical protein